MAKNKTSVQSLFQEEFQVKKTPEIKPSAKKEPAEPKETSQSMPDPKSKKPEKIKPVKAAATDILEKNEPEWEKTVQRSAMSINKATQNDNVKNETSEKETTDKAGFRSSSIYLSGENVNFIKYITRKTRVSQKQYINELLKDKQSLIEKEHPLVREKKVLDFKQPVRAKYRSNKENSTIYSISVDKSILDYFEKVCERDNITFSTMMDEMISEKREAFLAEQ